MHSSSTNTVDCRCNEKTTQLLPSPEVFPGLRAAFHFCTLQGRAAGPRWHGSVRHSTDLTPTLCLRAELSAPQGPPGAAECQLAVAVSLLEGWQHQEQRSWGKEIPAASATSCHGNEIFTDGLWDAQERASPPSSV